MAKITVHPDGVKIARPGFNHSPAKRDVISGWSSGSARRNRDFLMSVSARQLQGVAISFTLTIRDFPESHHDWERLRRSWVERLRRIGLIRMHWLTEFQKRGAPHLHGIVFFPEGRAPEVWGCHVNDNWLDLTAKYGAKSRGQHVQGMYSLKGWKMYLAKHGARSVRHYQRSTLPEGWSGSGRLWGKIGDWPTEVEEFFGSDQVFWSLRRLVRAQLLSQVRTVLRTAPDGSPARAEALRRIVYLRSRLKCCLLYTSPSPRDRQKSRMPSSA